MKRLLRDSIGFVPFSYADDIDWQNLNILSLKAISHWGLYPYRRRPQAFKMGLLTLADMKKNRTSFYTDWPQAVWIRKAYGYGPTGKDMDMFEMLALYGYKRQCVRALPKPNPNTCSV